MGSSRLPGKVMKPVAGEPVLAAMLHRLLRAQTPVELCVATTTAPEDAPIIELCRRLGLRCFLGHPTDLVERHLHAARAMGAEAVVKIPSDCPLIDPAIIDRVLGRFSELHPSVDYVSNLHPATYPDGNDVEVMTLAALEATHAQATKPFEREHTTPYIWEHPQQFRLANVLWETGQDLSMSHRFTLDYPEDLQFIERVFTEFGGPRVAFTLGDILQLLRDKPEIQAINAKYAGVNWYRHHLDELKHVRASETRQLDCS